jgi:5-methylcytosine-specific restriction endonuclease McrA
MSNELTAKTISCPYCGEHIDILVDGSLHIDILVDGSLPEQEYVEDCQVCCRPIVLSVTVDLDGDSVVMARGENE